jgi:hypothetical protein
MDVASILKWVTNHWLEILAVYGGLVTAASYIVKWTPTPKDDAWLAKVLSFTSKWIAVNPTEKK